ncbi:MAG: hypothetical protein RMM31_00345 [Anaerolineae bacterium]|nr:hypothetical protein [Thermoflexales bacterium]MDW8394672.1 hypothetical protein [Anaerolineae bacterium]
MAKALFEGLVFDEQGYPVSATFVGSEPVYVVVEDGFRYHVAARKVDEQVLELLKAQARQHEAQISELVMRMTGQDDLFTRAAVLNAVRNMDKSFAQLFEQGLPEAVRWYLGMLGFRVVINRHGELVSVDLPASADEAPL